MPSASSTNLLTAVAVLLFAAVACTAEAPTPDPARPADTAAVAGDGDGLDGGVDVAPMGEPEPGADSDLDAGRDADGNMEPWAIGAALGGSLHAAAEACGDAGPRDFAQVRARQRAEMAKMGVDAQRFDAVMTGAYDEAKRKLATTPPAELAAQCQSLREMEQMGAEMELEMEQEMEFEQETDR